MVTTKTCKFDDGVEEKLKLTSENLKTNHDAVVTNYNNFVTSCVNAINNTKVLFGQYGMFSTLAKDILLNDNTKVFDPGRKFYPSKYNFLEFFVYSQSKKFCFKKIVDEFYAHCKSCEQLIKENPQESKLSRELHEYFLDYISAYLFAHSKIWEHGFAFNKLLGDPNKPGSDATETTYPGWNKAWDIVGKKSSTTKSTLRVTGEHFDFVIKRHNKMHELLIPNEGGNVKPYAKPYGTIPILYYYFAIDSTKMRNDAKADTRARTGRDSTVLKGDKWYMSTEHATRTEINKIATNANFKEPLFTTVSRGRIGDGNYFSFFSQNIHKSKNIKEFFDNDAESIIAGAGIGGAGAGDINTTVEELTGKQKLKPLYDTYIILKHNYKGMPITESNICTLLDDAKGKRVKDRNNIFSDGAGLLLQNFAKFCLWLNWYTTPTPRGKTALTATRQFNKIDTECFRGDSSDDDAPPQTPDGRTCVPHDRERGWNSTKRLDEHATLHIAGTVTGSSRPNSAKQQGAIDRNPEIVTAGRGRFGGGGGKKTKRLHKKKRGKWTRHCKKNQTRPLRKNKAKPTKKK